ncbi:TPA: type II toxin-antitoxin system Phd/YefM family antitoxin [Candidatus Poribacteria bacterium]|nr:type II toxin-antitoxin system Phd/YefM family antitoxin [Candidatus Poribacteria bacterium]
MKFVSITELRLNASQLLNSLSEEETILVLSHGKPKAIIKPVSEEILDFDDVSYLYHRPSIKVRIEAAHQEHLEGKGEAIDDVIQGLENEL